MIKKLSLYNLKILIDHLIQSIDSIISINRKIVIKVRLRKITQSILSKFQIVNKAKFLQILSHLVLNLS